MLDVLGIDAKKLAPHGDTNNCSNHISKNKNKKEMIE